jgi:glycyl-tRNA synthetase beta subunit
VSEATHALRYWLDNPPTSNSDRYALEQAARAVLAELHTARAEAADLHEAASELISLGANAEDAQAWDDAWDELSAVLRSTK